MFGLWLSLIGMLMILCVYSKKCSAHNNMELEVYKIKKVINKYFDNQLVSIKTKVAIRDDEFIKNNNFAELALVQNIIKAESHKRFNHRIKVYNVSLEYKSIEFCSGRCVVELNKGVELTCYNAPYIVQRAKGENHIIVLQKYSGEWYMENDIYSFGKKGDKKIIGNKKYIGNKIENLIKEYNKFYIIEKQYKDALRVLPLKWRDTNINQVNRYTYDGYKARLYAYRNWNALPKVELLENDCTDFVSSCINAGGIPTSSSWRPYTKSWVGVVAFRNYLLQNNISIESSTPEGIEIGDVVQLQHKAVPQSSGIWGHTVLVTYIDNDNEMYIACHSEPRYNYPLSNYLIDALWENPFGAFRFERIKR